MPSEFYSTIQPLYVGVPPLQHVKTSTKLLLICAVMNTSDPTTSETTHLMDDKDFINRRDIPAVAISTLKEAKASVSFTSSYQLKQTSQKLLSAGLKEDMEIKLDSLQVQSKFKDSIQLEESTHLWRRIIDGMPAGQLSLILS